MGYKFRAREIEEHDITTTEALRSLGMVRTLTKPQRLLRMLEAVKIKNPALSGDKLWSGFIGMLVRERRPDGRPRRKYATVKNYLEVARRYAIHPNTMEVARNRVEAEAALGGLVAQAKTELSREAWRVVGPAATCRPIIWAAGDPILRAATYLLLATGCRAEHLSRIQRVRLRSHGIEIRWGARKVREATNAGTTYDFSWSARPPADLLVFLATWEQHHGKITASRNGEYVAAENVNRYLLTVSHGVKVFTSSYYRRRMATILLHQVVMDEMDHETYQILMDHTVGTAMCKYRLEGEAGELVIRSDALQR